MSKKSLITSLVIGAMLTLSLGLYTLVTAIIAATSPNHTTVAVAYTSEQTINAFSNFSVDAGNLTLKLADGQEDCLVLNKEDNTYTLDTEKAFGADSKVGDTFKFDAVATTDKYGSTITYNVTVYKQGTGASEEDYYVVANGNGLEVFADKLAAQTGAELEEGVVDLSKAYVNIVEDIDLAGKNWKGMGSLEKPFAGAFMSATGKTIKNMTINVNADNYKEYLGNPQLISGSTYYNSLSVGLFKETNGAVIGAFAMDNANITIDPAVYDLIKGDIVLNEKNTSVTYTGIGLLVGNAVNTSIGGMYISKYEDKEVPVTSSNTNTELVADGEEEAEVPKTEIIKVPVFGISSIKGTINGFEYTSNDGVVGMGGLVGRIDERSEVKLSYIHGYKVDVTINNNRNEKSNYIGGVVGYVIGNETDATKKVEISNMEVTLKGETLFNTANLIGGIAGAARNTVIVDVVTNVEVKDNKTNIDQVVAWLNAGNSNNDLTRVAGITARLIKSEVKEATANNDIDVKGYAAGAFVYVGSDNTVENVTTTGKIVAVNVAGFANEVNGTEIKYAPKANDNASTEEETETPEVPETPATPAQVVAANVELTGYYVAGFVNRLQGSSLVATDGNVKVNATINALGYEIPDADRNNTVYTAGLVGYFFANNLNNNFTVSGFDVNVTIYNGVDMAGLVAYVGDYMAAGTHRFVIENCSVVANLTSNNSASFDSTTHKVGGAVATIYGATTVNNVTADVHFNSNHNTVHKYGVAMFGGLVARIGGENVNITNCKVTGDAYANSTVYTRTFTNEDTKEESSYKQLVAGGLVGVIAGFGKNVTINPGYHPVLDITNASGEVARTVTYDALTDINVNTIKISGNNTSVNIDIDYTETQAMKEFGHMLRAAGKLIGTIQNSIIAETGYSVIDLTGNTATGKVDADGLTFSYLINSNGDTRTTKAGVIGISKDKDGNGEFKAEYNIDKVVTEVAEG